MTSDERIRMLSAQLLRSTNPEIIHVVADELKAAIDVYVEDVPRDFPVINPSSLVPETA